MEKMDEDPSSGGGAYVGDIAKQWLKEFENNKLTFEVYSEYWRKQVPRIYTPTLNESCLNWNFNEEEADRLLFDPLEEFICNGNTTFTAAGTATQANSSVCGRVFKLGEPTYMCRECGIDMTCVLCVDCFKKSDHRFHKYKMGTSSGGGCCDCGDVEAWKRAPYCDIHVQGDTLRALPEDIADRTRLIFDVVLWYAYRLLTLENMSALKLKDSEDELYDTDTYCTILYNDEVHTFEQVIQTISKVIKCSQKNAIEYVTNIDREGRAVVKCSNFETCRELKTEIEKITSRHGNKPLIALVVHSHVVAHQIFAMKLLSWLQKFLGRGEGFRKIFAEVALKTHPTEDTSIIKGILLNDTKLWKSARTHWHRLLISGMLLEYDNKKSLAKMFTKHYGTLMKDFIKDDHDHSFSVSSLSVQLFTVPTLAHHLILHDDALFTLLNTFISECSHKCNSQKKLELERNMPTMQSLKRAQYILYDLRYLLSVLPESWTDDLRKSFLQGFSLFLNLLSMMQGMDSTTRQVGQHMEYEPEWEAAFNLHIKLAYCISLMLKWCGTDKVVLVKAYRATLNKLYLELAENPCYDLHDQGEVRELLRFSAMCLQYDVTSRPVSIHLPLSRLLAGLHLYLEKYDLSFNGTEFQNCPKPNPVQIIEPVLRTQVMIGQVHAGMWRRNGYALLNQLYFYHNVKCRTEMLDRDIALLQIGASLIEGNEFLIHLLNKFGLHMWLFPQSSEQGLVKANEDDSMRQTISLNEEFLQLLIVIVAERHTPGISNCTVEDRIKKEVIQHLCIKPLPHSELNKTIPDDLTHETGLEEVIGVLADFKKPSVGNGKGVYELKPEYFNDYNVFFYHYTREELSKSEETQRNRRKAAGELECVPPPPLPKLNASFEMIVNLLQCDIMLYILQTVLNTSLDLKSRYFSELQLHKALHLIGFALQEEESKNYPFLEFGEKATRWKIPSLLEELSTSARVEAQRGLIHWTLNKFKQVMKAEEVPLPSTSDSMETDTQKADVEKERRAKLAAERRAKIMAQMQAQQNNFMKDNAEMFTACKTEVTHDDNMDTTEPINLVPVALGPNQTTRTAMDDKVYICILCQEEQKITLDKQPMVLAAFVHQATVLCQQRNYDYLIDHSNLEPLYLNANLGPAPHTSTCGHVMHRSCWQTYYDSVVVKEHRRPYRFRSPASFDVDKQEFLCPLCECLSNTVLLLLPSLSSIQEPPPKTDITFDTWLTCMESTISNRLKLSHGKCNNESCANQACNSCTTNATNSNEADASECDSTCNAPTHQVYKPLSKGYLIDHLGDDIKDFITLFPTDSPALDTGLADMIQLYTQVAYTRGLNVYPHPTDRRLTPMAWKSCAYTIHAIETIMRDNNKPLLMLSSRHRDCLESLVRILGVMGSALLNIGYVISSHALCLLSMVFEHPNDGPSILDWDSFGVLVPLNFSLPSLFCKENATPVPTGSALEHHTLRLIFISHIVKILITSDFNSMGFDDEMEAKPKPLANEAKTISKLLSIINRDIKGVSMEEIWEQVTYACRPFLRCCVLLYHFMTDVPAPQALLEIDGDSFEIMCAYLDLPTAPSELFASDFVMKLVTKWCMHEEVRSYVTGNGTIVANIVKEPLPVNRLVKLPHDYSELINTVSLFTCPNSDHEDSRNPTMCLVCGEILCSQSYCCQTEVNKVIMGACNYHAHKCGAGVGIFLRVRECEILYLAATSRGCFMSPPYLDDYGETDPGLRRGNPLHLCVERYKKLESQWLNHSIYEDISRAMEASSALIPTQWQHL